MRQGRQGSGTFKPIPVIVFALFLGIAAFYANVAESQQAPQNPQGQTNQFEIKSSVNLVVLHLTVQRREGTLIGGLDRNNFAIYEDRVLQQVESFSHEDVPVTLGLVLDNSGSMSGKRPEVVAAALAFARASNPRDEMFVINFNETVSFGLPRNTPFTDQPAELEKALPQRMLPAGLRFMTRFPARSST